MTKKREQAGRKLKSTPDQAIWGIPDKWIPWLLALFAFLLYANTLGHGYVSDDDLAIALNSNIQQGIPGIIDLFTQPYRDQCFGGCLYRPLTLAMFSLEWMISPKDPFIGHLVNVIWYAATSALLYLTLRRLLPDQNRVFACIACLLFIAHPIHTEVVANIKSRDEIMSLFFVLLSVYHYSNWFNAKHWKFILYAGISFLAALLSKEGAITALVLFPFIGWLFYKKTFLSSLKSCVWLLVPIAFFFLLRGAALSGLIEPPIPMADNPIVDAQGTERWGTAFFVLLKYFLLLLFPYQLISDYSYNALPLRPVQSAGSIIGILLYGGLTVYAVIGMLRKRLSSFFVAAFLASISLYSQLVIVIGTIMGERLAYLPSLWFILAAVSLGFELSGRWGNTFIQKPNRNTSFFMRNGAVFCFSGIMLWFSVHTFIRNKDWYSDFTLQKADVVKSPESCRLNDGYAKEIYESLAIDRVTPDEVTRRLDLSEKHSIKSISLHPGVTSYTNMANIAMLRKDYPLALDYYLKIVDISADRGIAERNVASFLIFWAKEEAEKNNNPTHALELLKQAEQYNPADFEIFHGRAVIKYGLGNMTEAQENFEKAYQLAPDNTIMKSDLVKFYISRGMKDKADALQ